MTSWDALNVLKDTLISYYFGSPVAFYAALVVLFILALSIAGLDIKLAIIFSLPLVAAFTINGLWGSYTWANNLFLLVVALIYGFVLLELFT